MNINDYFPPLLQYFRFYYLSIFFFAFWAKIRKYFVLEIKTPVMNIHTFENIEKKTFPNIIKQLENNSLRSSLFWRIINQAEVNLIQSELSLVYYLIW